MLFRRTSTADFFIRKPDCPLTEAHPALASSGPTRNPQPRPWLLPRHSERAAVTPTKTDATRKFAAWFELLIAVRLMHRGFAGYSIMLDVHGL